MLINEGLLTNGMPIIAFSEGETKKIIEESNIGFCSNLGDTITLSNNIISAYKNIFNNDKLIYNDIILKSKLSREYFLCHFNKTELMDEMEKFFM